MSSDTPLDDAWKAAEAALPLGGWVENAGLNARWVAPSGIWDINVRHFPASGDGHFEPAYPDVYEATATVEPHKRFAGTAEESPAAALLALAEKLTRA